MAVAFDAVGPSSAGQGGTGTSISWSHTCTGSNRYVIVGVSNSADGATASVTFNGVSMTALTAAIHSNNSNQGYGRLFGLVNPPTGTSTVAVSSTSSGDLSGGSISFTGVDQTTPVGTPVTAIGGTANTSVTVTGTTAGNMVVCTVTNGSAVLSSGQTQRYIKNYNTSSAAGNSGGSTAAAGGSVAMTWSTTDDWWASIAVEILAAAATADTSLVIPRRPARGLILR